jgi:vacuolar-type H+-ATPase subunit E/Vma4
LKTNAALIEQRIHTAEGGARQNLVVNVSKSDQARADELLAEIDAQQKNVAEARREGDRYSGGLVKALSESTAATATNSLAMLEQL